ncbi:tetratricopeptide repeat protein [Flammeovirga yaeyamensis]|uniref:Tetratricopeptide repeat protein n=1 Tax=Flammeovirga yaeyamensis TaxID=367791 RepID=A0AAX1N3G0_9BACT|nr:tetratricopeptide repeat protein [Flammeovirga yaeyamensis]MBB3701532.1 tetratricopeptide (TPR) repeat protein [Flammeovirga yaeyamensis]NMF38654.1 tetratricopeptide repeat protein [Flammeovirga yaeyamensis]QWG01851.1 tetratricopeptide repeat protein [Flammeovirga yaeyamensis]
MGKKQYILIFSGIVLIALFALLPKAVIIDNTESVDSAPSAETHSEDDGHDHSDHDHQTDAAMGAHDKLPADTQNTLDSLEHAFSSAKASGEKSTIANTAYELLFRMNKFDQAAGWKLASYGQTKNIEELKEGADAYYQAFTFAMSEQKSAKMAKLARENYQKYIDINGEDLDAKVKIGMTYVVSEAPMKGITMIREVLAKDPEHQLALSSLGILSIQSGQFDKAIERFEKVKELYPKDMESRFYLAIALNSSGKNKEAIEEMKYISKNADTEEIRLSATQTLAEWDN